MILVTGAAGFIGFSLVKKLLSFGYDIIGIDNINNYYATDLKHDRLRQLGISIEDSLSYGVVHESKHFSKFKFIKTDIENQESIDKLFGEYQFQKVVHLAAQAGVRYSIENPRAYINSNIVGYFNMIESCRQHGIKHFLYASSSSVYGMNKEVPFSVEDNVDYPISLYAATKKSNELIAHTYSHLYKLRTTGMRFFTVYGPWGRPDMAYHLFADLITNDKTIKVFNHGDLMRDFTYIDDVVNGIQSIIESDRDELYEVYNIGNNQPVKLMDFIKCIEHELGVESKKEFLPMQAGDVYTTYADIDPMIQKYNYAPSTDINAGIKAFISWYSSYYK